MQIKRNSIFKRMGLFVSKPYLEWGDTVIPLDEGELKKLRFKADLVKRVSEDMAGRSSELGALRKKIEKRRDSDPALADGQSRVATDSDAVDGASKAYVPRYGRKLQADSMNDSGGASSKLVQPGSVASPRRSGGANQKKAAAKRQYMNTLARLPGDSQHLPVEVQDTPEAMKVMRFMDTDEMEGARPQVLEATGAFYVEQDSREVTVQSLAAGVSAVADAALCVASADFIKAEVILRDALKAPRENVELLSLAWLDLLNVLDRPAQYAAEAVALMQRFGTTAPQYRRPRGDALGASRFTSKRHLSTGDAQRLSQMVAGHTPAQQTLTLSFANLETIEETAMPALAAALKRLNALTHAFVFAGSTRLNDALESHFQGHRMTLTQHAFDARLECFRLSNMQLPYVKLGVEYATKFPSPAPEWRAPTASFKTYADAANMQLEPLQYDRAEALPLMAGTAELSSESAGEPGGSAQAPALRFDGTISSDNVDELVEALEARALEWRLVMIDCGSLLRIDFQAAVALLNWFERAAERKIGVKLHDIGVLSEALLQTLGADQFAQFKRRVA